jgi:hypothetical protein
MTEAPPRPTLGQNRLRLRRPADIAWGYVLGPAAGLTVLFVLMLALGVVDPAHRLAHVARLSLAFFYIYLLIFGGLVCLAVELVVITPLLIGFHRFRWRWLNGWTGALIGFALAFAATLLVVEFAPRRGYAAGGWIGAMLACSAVGLVGAVAAGVFRLLAVRRTDDAEDAA